MIVQRLQDLDSGIALVASTTQYALRSANRELVLCTLRLITDGTAFEQPLTAVDVMEAGGTWFGKIVLTPDVSIGGFVKPAVWVDPSTFVSAIPQSCVVLSVAEDRSITVSIPASFHFMWKASGNPSSHGYSLDPQQVIIDNCLPATFLATTPGAVATQQDEGSAVLLGSGGGSSLNSLGLLVDVEIGRGFAISLASVITEEVFELLGV